MLQCVMQADGIRMVEPGGKVMTSFSSQRMRCPPRVGSKSPREVIAHQPNGRLLKSLCLKQTVLGPKLIVAAAQGELGKLGMSSGWRFSSSSRYLQ